MAGLSVRDRWALLALGVLVLAAYLASALTPKKMLADTLPPLQLERAIPEQIGDWRHEASIVPILPDPTVTAKLNALYTQTFNRTYINRDGTSAMMVNISYGKNQNSESTAAHRPEFCYAAQGFEVSSSKVVTVKMGGRSMDVVRLLADVQNRHEPITYWVTLGPEASAPGWRRKLKQLEYGLRGWIVDGMLVRVSSVTRDNSEAGDQAEYEKQLAFLSELLKTLQPQDRQRIFGF
jgi:EpsI family protein